MENVMHWGSPVGVALTFGQSTSLRYVGLCTGLLSCLSSTARLRAEAQIYLRSNDIHVVIFLKAKSALEGYLGTKIVAALMLFPTYSYLSAVLIYGSECK